MADNSQKISQLPQLANVTSTDRVLVLRDPSGSPSTRTITTANLFLAIPAANSTYAGVVKVGDNLTINSTGYLIASNADAAYTNAIAYSGNAAQAYSNAITYVSTQSFVNTSQLSSNLSSYQTTAGLSANVAKLSANNTLYLNGVAANQYAFSNSVVSSTPNIHFVNSTNYVALANDNVILVNNNGADRTVYLPNTGLTEGKTYTIKKTISFTSTNTIVSANGLTIDGSASVNINSGYGYITVMYSNSTGTSAWWSTSKQL